MADFHHLWCHSEPGVDTLGIYVENHHGSDREFFIWILFDHNNLIEKGSRPLLLDDFLIFQSCSYAFISSFETFSVCFSAVVLFVYFNDLVVYL